MSRPRGTLPDAVKGDTFILIKACSTLRLTYQIRLQTFMAKDSGKKLLIVCPVSVRVDDRLAAFLSEHSDVVSIKRGSR